MKKLIFLLLLVFPLNVLAEIKTTKVTTTTTKKPAAELFTVSCDKTDKIDIGEQLVCRVNVDSDFWYNKISFNIVSSEGFEIVDIRSNYTQRWTIEQKNNGVVEVTSKDLQTGLQEFGIFLIKTTKSGVYDFTLSDLSLVDTFSESDKSFKDASEKLKIISTDNSLKEILIDGEKLKDFNPDKTNYTIKVNDEESIKIGASSNNEFANINGTGEFKLSSKVLKFVFPITVISEDNVSKVYLLNVVRDNVVSNFNEGLDSIIIKNDKGNNLLISFSSNVYEYNLDVDINTEFLEIKPVLKSDDLSFLKSYGGKKLNLKSGNNIVIIKVQNKAGDVLNYVLNVTKPIANRSSNNYIKSLDIEGYNLKFNKSIKNYNLAIKANDNRLNIITVLDSETAKYEIVGNDNLKAGSVIKIIVTAENQESAIYKINITIMKPHIFRYVLIGMVLCLAGYLVYKNSSKLLVKVKSMGNIKHQNSKSKSSSKKVQAVKKNNSPNKKQPVKKKSNSKSNNTSKKNSTKKKTSKKKKSTNTKNGKKKR